MLKRLLTVLLFLFASTGVYSQLGKTHYIPPVAKGDTGSDEVAVQHIYLTTPIEGTISAYIKPVGGTRTDWIPVSFSNNNPLDWPIPNNQFTVNDNLAGKVSNKGYIIESSNVFYANVRFNSGNEAQQGGFVSKGKSAPGTEFRTAVAPNGTTTSTNIGFTAINFISIMATEDNTLVKIDGINFSSSSIINSTPTGPIALDRGESYVVIQRIRNTNASEKTPAQRLDLIGAGIKSVDAFGNKDQSKPIVVNSGSVAGTWDGMDGGGSGDRSRDFHVDQLVGLETLQNGNEYIFVKGEGSDGHENVMLIASQANTSIFIDGSTTVYETLTNAGDFLIIEGDKYTTNLYVTSSSPVFAFQSTGRSARANQGMIFVPPLNCSAKGDINNVGFVGNPVIGAGVVGSGLYSIVTQVGATLSIENKDGVVLADKTGTAPINLNNYESTVTGNSAYVTYLIKNSSIDAEKHISIRGDGELYFSYISLNNYATSGSFFSGFVTDPQIVPDLTVIPKGICIDGSGTSNVILETFQTFDTYLWEVEQPRNSGTFVPADGTNNNQSYTPTTDGVYRLSGTLICSGNIYTSSNQIVSVCPTDNDNDGIIDNLDLDLDNDGILNSLESIAKIEIDLSDANNAKATLPTGNKIFNSNYSASTSSLFNGTSVGTFLSKVVPNSINEKSTFEINPFISSGSTNEKLNIRFTEDSSVNFNGDSINEYYSLTVYPSDKNITLLDPGERILVNDGSGFVTTGEFGFSGNTIIFKYNSNPLDSSVEFNFYAYDVEGIDFNHHVTNLAISDANFNGLIEIIDYDIDSDNDGTPDKLDLDSDGDGCPDVEEADINFDNATGIRPRIFRDPDKNGEYGDQSTTPPFKLEYLAVGGTLDSRGRIIDLINSTSGTYDNPPLDPISGIPVYLEINAPSVVFSAGGQPEDYQICEIGQDAEFKVTVDSGGYTPFYQWQVDIQDGNGWKNLLNDPATTPLTIDATLEIKSVTAAMDGWEYRVLTWSDGAFCYRISNSAVLKVEATLPTAKAVDLADPLFDENWIIKCDDGPDQYDGIATFDLTLIDDYIRGPLQSSTDFEVSYFLNATDAASPSTTGITNPTTFTNTPSTTYDPANPSTQTLELHVRVRNINSNCIADPMSFELTINTVPLLLTPTVDFLQCDLGIFNLTDQEDNFSLNYANEVFEYYDSTGTLIDPINGLDPTNYAANGQKEIITVTIKTKPSLGTACVNTTATINLEWSVTTLPPAYTLIDQYLIETDPDPKGQGQDGIETFDKTIFATVQAGLIKEEPAFVGKTFSFYRSQNDALTSFNKIDTTVDFTTDDQTNDGWRFNTAENRWEQQIWVYIEDSVTTAIATCYGLYQIATVYVEKRPVFYDVSTQELCDAETPLDIYSLFDTSLLFSDFTTDSTGSVAQNTSLFTVEYTYVDDIGATKTLDPILPLSFNSTDQTITVTLTNNSTNSALPAGVSSGTIEFKVYQQPVAYSSDPSVPAVYTFEECDDDNDGLAVGEEVFDMSTIKTDLLTDISGTYPAQDPGDFDFEFSVAGTVITLGNDYTAETGDQIEVKITNPLYPVCEETITIDFKVNPLPSFDTDDTTVICLNLTQPVEIRTLNPKLPNYIYSWTLDSDPSFSETTETIFPNKGGIYTVVAQDPITFCTQTKSITVTESDVASIDLDKDGVVTDSEYNHFVEVLDLTDDNTNTITINNVTDLGIGDYEFSLNDAFGPYRPNPVFTNLPPDVYTVYIRDKNSYYSYNYGCGITEIKVSVIGYKKYFTPNGDRFNEKWKVIGIRPDFNSGSRVFIFDRYGKLLKELDPLSDGWDGTFLGKPMPATDYWFRAKLEDGREISDHFSLIRGKTN